MGFEFLIPIFGILVVLVPIIGLTTILTLRYGLRPFIETLAKELKGTSYVPELGPPVEVVDLTEQIALLTEEVRRLKEAQEFDPWLLEGQGAPPEVGV
jgi:hypothetical protein